MSDAAPAVPAVSHAHLHRDAVAALTAYRPSDGSQQRLRDDYLAHLAIHPDGVAKAGPPSHLTASCLVVEQSARHVLLTLHRRAGRWFQFGGHLEASDASLWAAAAREGREESGITALTPARTIVELNRHTLEGNFGRCREHLDVRYLAVVPDGTPPVCSEESEQVAWWPVDALPEGPHGDVADLVRVALRTLAALRV